MIEVPRALNTPGPSHSGFAGRFDPVSGQILLMGEAGHEAAREVQRVRGWPIVAVRDFVEIGGALRASSGGAALVVTQADPRNVRPMISLAQEVALHSPRILLGYLYGRDPRQLCHAAESMLRPKPAASAANHPIRLFNMLPSRHPVRAAGLFDANASTPDKNQVIRLLQQTSELDILVGHSNGCDMGLGGVLLCRRDSAHDRKPDDLRVMPCYHDGVCSRHAANKGTVTSSDHVGARRVILACCWGVTMGQGPFSPAFSIGESLLLHAGVSSLIATLRVAGFETPELTLMHHYCAAGVPFGAVVNLANQLRLRSGFESEWMCFGDPTSSLASVAESAWTEVSSLAPLSAVVRPPAEQGTRDVAALVPADLMPTEPVALTWTKADEIFGAISPDGELFLTIDPELTSEVRVDIVSRDSLKQTTAIPAELPFDLEFLEIYLQGPLREAYPSQTEAAMGAMLAVRRMLLNWAPAGTPAGSILSYQTIAAQFEILDNALTRLSERVLDVVSAYTLRSGCMQSQLWVWAYDQIASTKDEQACSHCGSAVEQVVMHSKCGDGERRIGFCDGCGFLYDGHRSTMGRLEAADVIAPGSPCRLNVTLRNTSMHSRQVRALGVFDRHETNGSVFVREDFGFLRAGEERKLELIISVPTNAARGVNYLGMTVMLGATLICYQRPLLVA